MNGYEFFFIALFFLLLAVDLYNIQTKYRVPIRNIHFRIYKFSIVVSWSVVAIVVFVASVIAVNPNLIGIKAFAAMLMGHLILVFLHELGHAIAARCVGLQVYGLQIHGVPDAYGGCYVQEPTTPGKAILMYSGGILAQLSVLTLTILYLVLYEEPNSIYTDFLFITFMLWNIFLVVTNLIPRRNSSGATDGYWIFHHAFDKPENNSRSVSI